MKKFTKTLFFNASIAFVLAGMVATTLHEFFHLLTGKLIGEGTTLFPTMVDYASPLSNDQQILTASAGPVLSIVLGLFLIFAAKNWGKGFVRLFWMWLGFMSAQIGFGYFMIALFARNGDTGKVFDLLGAPDFVYWLSLLVGIAGTLWLSKMFAERAVKYTDGTDEKLRAFGIFSWLTGSAILMFIYLFAVRTLPNDVQFICLLGVFAAGIFAPMFSFFYKKVKTNHEELALTTPYVGLILTIVMATVLIVTLPGGLNI